MFDTIVPTILDSGQRREFSTGAHRDRVRGKGAFNLLPFQALLEVAQIFEVGAEKYTADNWRLGMSLSEYLNSAMRHTAKAAAGWNDENHAAMACWNMMCFMETREMIRNGLLPSDLDDVRDWYSEKGVAESFDQVRRDNARKMANRSANPSTG